MYPAPARSHLTRETTIEPMTQTAPTNEHPGARRRGRPLRVLHGVYEIAGQGMVLALGLRARGCEARSFSYTVAWEGRVSDIVVDLERAPGFTARHLAMLGAFVRQAPRFDVFHLHFGRSFLPRLADVPILRRMGRRIVFHFHGCEVRNRTHMLATHRLSTCTDCDPFCRPRHQQWLLARTAALADHAFYSTLDLGESLASLDHGRAEPFVEQLPLAIESERWIAAGREHPLPDHDRRDGVNGPVVIAHAPTNRLIKGTHHVIEAVERLKREFPRLELRLIERRPWAEMPALLAASDILIDQLHMGWYGLLAIEGMAVGRTVVAHLREDFRPGTPDLPVVDAEPKTIEGVLRDLIRDPRRRAGIGRRGPEFARARHDAAAVAGRLLDVYGRLLERPRARAAAGAGTGGSAAS